MSDPNAPIVVNGSATQSQLLTALRSFLIALVAYASGRGWIDAQLGTAGAGLVLVLLPVAWSQLASLFKQQKLVAVAQATPDQVVVK